MHEGLREGLSLLALLFARIDALPGQVVDIATMVIVNVVTVRCPSCPIGCHARLDVLIWVLV